MHPFREETAGNRASLAGAAWLGLVHLLVDAACVTSVLRAAPPSDGIIAGAFAFVIAYDVLAFAGQGPLGWLADRFRLRRAAATAGIVLTAAAVALSPWAGYAVVVVAGLGNALFHLGAGAMVLAAGRQKASPAGVFVAPGALGLGMGLLLGRRFLTVPVWPSLFALAAALAVVWLVPARTDAKTSASEPAFSPSAVLSIALLLCLSIAVRSLVGTVAGDDCPKTLLLGVALPFAGFAGKLAGGFLADRFGWIELSMVALLASAPLLAFSGGDLWLVLPGTLLFQMTMPVTLAAMFRVMPGRPALAFGLPCVALIVGALPAYLPDVWRPRGVPVLVLVIGSAAVLLVALRLLRIRRASSQHSPEVPASSNLCRGNS